MLAFWLLLAAAPAAAQSLTSNQLDYSPGMDATLTGAGFAPFENVTMQVLHADGSPSTHPCHDPWTVAADPNGGFVTTWHVPDDGHCLGALLRANADGVTSLLHAQCEFMDGPQQGTGVVTLTALGGSCLDQTPPSGGGPYNWEVAQGGTYTMTITGVSECSGNDITVFAQGSFTGNFCFNATQVSAGIYVGTFTMPNPACYTYPLSYKCGANQPCNNANTYDARGPGGASDVHLRASTFNGSCVRTGDDTNCQPDCCTPILGAAGANDTINCGTTPVFTPPTVTNNCAANLTFNDVPTPGNCAGNYSVTRTWRATGTDSCHNLSNPVSQTITVQDTTAPNIGSAGADATIDCSQTPSFTPPSATDDCSGATVSQVGSDDVTPGNCASNYSVRRTWRAVDGCGNASNPVSQTITVRDTTAPTIGAPGANATIDCSQTPSFTAPTATDDCSGATVSQVGTDEVTPGNCAGNYSVRRTWRAVDGCGNASNPVSQTITVQDTTAPVVTCPPSVTVEALGGCTGQNITTATATDDCSGVQDITPNPAGPYPIGTTQVTWTARDGCGNQNSCTQNVTVLGQICIRKFYDANGNGFEDGTEAGIAGWKFLVSGVALPVYTDATGNACVSVSAGQHTVTEVAPAAGWQNTSPLTCTVTIGPTNCAQLCTFGNYCFRAPSNGLTLGFWGNKNGEKILGQNPGWVALLNNLACLRNANGTLHTFSTFADLKTWLGSANATNMAYMLSAQLAANVLDEAYNQLSGSTNVVVAGGSKTGGNVCLVGFLSTVQPISCGSPALLSLTSVAGSGACGCSYNNGLVMIDDLQARAVCLLQAYGNTTPASTQRTYQECVKNILDMINNNGNNGYACGGVTQFINPSQSSCPFGPY